MRRIFLASILLLIAGTAYAATNGVSADFSKGVVLLGSPAGAANCKAAVTGAIRYNSVSNVPEYCNGSAWIPFDPCTVVQPYDWGGAAGGAFPGGSAWGDGTYIYTGGAPPSSSDLEAWTFTNSTHLWTNKAYTNTPANGFYNIWGDGTYLYLSEGISGIQAYSFNGTTFTLKGTYNTTMSSNWVWGTGGTIYVADGTHGLKAFTFNGTTFTLKATAAPASINANSVWGDGTYVYVVDTGNKVVDAYTFNGVAFTLKGTLASPGWGNWSYVSGDGTYVYVTGNNGYNMITAYTFNGTTFTQQGSSMNFIGDPGGVMWITNGDIYVTTTGIEVYSFGGSSFTYKGFIPSYAGPIGNIWADSNNVYWSDGYGNDFYASSLCH